MKTALNAPRRPRLVLCSHGYWDSPEGICTGRLVSALVGAGWDLDLITASTAPIRPLSPRLRVHRVGEGPAWLKRVFNGCARRLQRPLLETYWWARRAARVALARRPDVVYGRGLPLASLVAATDLSRRYRVPLALHFSDPIPSPWDGPETRSYRVERRWSRRLLRSASSVTFVTREALEFQEQATGLSLRARALVLPHVAPTAAALNARPSSPPRLCYVGSFYGRRRADALLRGFARYRAAGGQAELHFVGTDPHELQAGLARQGLHPWVRVHARTSDLEPHYADASVLVAVDAFVGRPVFLATKLVEYLAVPRPILLLSPSGSPGRTLLETIPGSSVGCDEDEATIADAIARLIRVSTGAVDYSERDALRRQFDGQSLANALSEHWRLMSLAPSAAGRGEPVEDVG
jgi:glycosyltransferase involved in cell wall biosynthesis